MDAKDVRIFCEMAFGNFGFTTVLDRHVNAPAIARAVGLDEKTVRLRIRKMEDDGFIKHYQVIPNIGFFGLGQTGLYRFEALNLATKLKVVDYTNQIPNVLETSDYLGHNLSINFAGANLEDVQRYADHLASRFELSNWNLQSIPIRKPSYRMEKLDWQITKGLRYNARRTTTDLARALCVTARMTEYRMQKLMESGALLIRASIDPRKQKGIVFYELELTTDDANQSRVSRSLVERHGDRLWSMVLSPKVMLVNLFGFSLAEPEDAAIDAARYEGVKSCTLYILKESTEPRGPNWIDNKIDAELAKF